VAEVAVMMVGHGMHVRAVLRRVGTEGLYDEVVLVFKGKSYGLQDMVDTPFGPGAATGFRLHLTDASATREQVALLQWWWEQRWDYLCGIGEDPYLY